MSFPDQSMLKLGVPKAIANSRTTIVDKGNVAASRKVFARIQGRYGHWVYRRRDGRAS